MFVRKRAVSSELSGCQPAFRSRGLPVSGASYNLLTDMRILSVLTAVLIACVCACGRAEAPPLPTGPGHAQRVMIVSIDGGRPDVVLRAKAPNIRALMKDGSFSFWARTTEVSVTL